MKLINFLKRNLFLFLWILAFCLNIITFLIVFYKINPFHRTIALKYNVLVGVEWYGKGKNLFLIPFAAFCISIVNIILYRVFKNDKHIFSFLIILITLLVQIIFLLSVLFLATIN